MNIIEKLFALKRCPLFRLLEDGELILVADTASHRTYAPGSPLARPGSILRQLLVVVDGEVRGMESGQSQFTVLGIESLVLEKPLEQGLEAGPAGATCLVLSKGHFFTIVNECPEMLARYLDRESNDPQSGEFNPVKSIFLP